MKLIKLKINKNIYESSKRVHKFKMLQDGTQEKLFEGFKNLK